jgi:hypothetical protein
MHSTQPSCYVCSSEYWSLILRNPQQHKHVYCVSVRVVSSLSHKWALDPKSVSCAWSVGRLISTSKEIYSAFSDMSTNPRQHKKSCDYRYAVIKLHYSRNFHFNFVVMVQILCRSSRGWLNWCEVIFRWRMTSSGMLRRVALIRTDVSEEFSASIIRVTSIGWTRNVTRN